MIHEVIPIIASELNDYFESQFDAGEDKVKVSNLVNQDGTLAIVEENQMVMSIINIERDMRNQRSVMRTGGNPTMNINVNIMFAACFTSANYIEGLKFLSGVIGFFQRKNVFTQHNTPMLEADIESFVVEMVNIDFREVSNLWAAIGGKYLPSVIYRIRSLKMDGDMISDDIPDVGGIENI